MNTNKSLFRPVINLLVLGSLQLLFGTVEMLSRWLPTSFVQQDDPA